MTNHCIASQEREDLILAVLNRQSDFHAFDQLM